MPIRMYVRRGEKRAYASLEYQHASQSIVFKLVTVENNGKAIEEVDHVSLFSIDTSDIMRFTASPTHDRFLCLEHARTSHINDIIKIYSTNFN